MRDKSASKVGDKAIDLEHGQMQADGQQDRMGLTAKNARSREGMAAKRRKKGRKLKGDYDQELRLGLRIFTAENADIAEKGVAAKKHKRRKSLAADDSDCSKGINRKAV